MSACTASRHGTRSAYSNDGCRCPEAKQARSRVGKLERHRAVRGIAGPDAPVDATATRRRVQALAAIGWSHAHLAERLGVSSEAVGQWTRRQTVKPSTVARVAALYDELWRTPGPSDHARRRATARGYLPPLWWDDDLIDDPTYDPRTDVASRQTLRHEARWERIERVARLSRAGLSLAAVAREVGKDPRQVSRDLADYRERYGVDAHQLDELAREEALEHEDDSSCCHPLDLESVAS